MSPRFYYLILGVFLIWATVGLFVVAFNRETPFGAWADLIFMVLAALIVFLSWARYYGMAKTWKAFLWVAVWSGLVETVGATTGFPFGEYGYTANFGPQIGGVLPVAIPLAWWVIVGTLYFVVDYALYRLSTIVTFNAVTLLILVPVGSVAIDFTLEPVATLVREYWIWADGDFYYGVPFSNFVGWFMTAWIATGGLFLLTFRKGPRQTMAPVSVSPSVAVLFSVVLLFWASSLIQLQILAILIGFLNLVWLGIVLTLSARSESRRMHAFRHRLSSYERKVWL